MFGGSCGEGESDEVSVAPGRRTARPPNETGGGQTASPHSLLPHIVPQQAYDGKDDQAKVKHAIRPQRLDETLVFERKANQGRNDGVQREGDHGEDERAWDGRECVLGPEAVRAWGRAACGL